MHGTALPDTLYPRRYRICGINEADRKNCWLAQQPPYQQAQLGQK